jgi:Tol biopolymer transport system component
MFGPELISWSPDSERLLFAAVLGPRTVYYELYGVDRDGEDLLAYDLDLGNIKSVAWHPLENTILYTATLEGVETEIYLMEPDGSDVRRLTTTGGFNGLEKGDAKWSPDGAAIAYATVNWFRPDPGVDDRAPHHTLRVMNADGSSDQEVVAAPSDVGYAVDEFEWAPDGRHIAYGSTRFIGEERGPSDLRVVNVCTGEDHLLAEDILTYTLSWNPLP